MWSCRSRAGLRPGPGTQLVRDRAGAVAPDPAGVDAAGFVAEKHALARVPGRQACTHPGGGRGPPSTPEHPAGRGDRPGAATRQGQWSLVCLLSVWLLKAPELSRVLRLPCLREACPRARGDRSWEWPATEERAWPLSWGPAWLSSCPHRRPGRSASPRPHRAGSRRPLSRAGRGVPATGQRERSCPRRPGSCTASVQNEVQSAPAGAGEGRGAGG